jgi:hypothetical protein
MLLVYLHHMQEQHQCHGSVLQVLLISDATVMLRGPSTTMQPCLTADIRPSMPAEQQGGVDG